MKFPRIILALIAIMLVVSGCLYADDSKLKIETLLSKVKEFSQKNYWPGYKPETIPLAVYDGKFTYLYKHPSAPDGFSQVSGQLYRMEGRHEAVVANSSAEIGGTRCATLMSDLFKDRGLLYAASVVLHEKFHVFQANAFKKWGINEAVGFTYPMRDSKQNELFLLEREALARALEAKTVEETISWAKLALEIRQERFERIGDEAAGYDRSVEAIEGTAFYVERSSIGTLYSPDNLREGFKASEVRRRCYSTGSALAAILDKLKIEWKNNISSGELPLDTILSKAIEESDTRAASFEKSLLKGFKEKGQQLTQAYLSSLKEIASKFYGAAGYRLEVVVKAGGPLWPKGFDPMNVLALDDKNLLHQRFVKLGNENAEIMVMNKTSLSHGAGEHILFTGVDKLIITGLKENPVVENTEGKVTVKADGIEMEFQKAKTETAGKVVKVLL